MTSHHKVKIQLAQATLVASPEVVPAVLEKPKLFRNEGTFIGLRTFGLIQLSRKHGILASEYECIENVSEKNSPKKRR